MKQKDVQTKVFNYDAEDSVITGEVEITLKTPRQQARAKVVLIATGLSFMICRGLCIATSMKTGRIIY